LVVGDRPEFVRVGDGGETVVGLGGDVVLELDDPGGAVVTGAGARLEVAGAWLVELVVADVVLVAAVVVLVPGVVAGAGWSDRGAASEPAGPRGTSPDPG
jgi:hypothetical protein